MAKLRQHTALFINLAIVNFSKQYLNGYEPELQNVFKKFKYDEQSEK